MTIEHRPGTEILRAEDHAFQIHDAVETAAAGPSKFDNLLEQVLHLGNEGVMMQFLVGCMSRGVIPHLGFVEDRLRALATPVYLVAFPADRFDQGVVVMGTDGHPKEYGLLIHPYGPDVLPELFENIGTSDAEDNRRKLEITGFGVHDDSPRA